MEDNRHDSYRALGPGLEISSTIVRQVELQLLVEETKRGVVRMTKFAQRALSFLLRAAVVADGVAGDEKGVVEEDVVLRVRCDVGIGFFLTDHRRPLTSNLTDKAVGQVAVVFV